MGIVEIIFPRLIGEEDVEISPGQRITGVLDYITNPPENGNGGESYGI